MILIEEITRADLKSNEPGLANEIHFRAQMGRNIANTVPDRDSVPLLFTMIRPPYFVITCAQVHNPNPVPVASFVVKNGSNNLLRVSAVIPLPVSPTVMSTPRLLVTQSLHPRIRRRNVPPWGIASSAFLTTFNMTWRSSSRWQLIIETGR